MKYLFLVFALALSLVSGSSRASDVEKFTEQIMQLNRCVEFSVTSWIRSKSRNEKVGGAEESQHLTGLAVDIVLDDKRDKDFLLRKLDKLGYYYLDEPDHIHIGYREVKNVSSRDSDDARFGDPSWADEGVGSSDGKREAETPALYAGIDSSAERESRDKEQRQQRVYLDTKSNCSVSGVRCVDLAEGGSYILRYYGSLRVDRDESGVLVLHSGSGGSEMAHDSGEHNSPDTPRHPYSLSDNRAVLWREYSGPQVRYMF